MGMMKDYTMELEDRVWEYVGDIIPECDDIEEAIDRGVEIAKDFDLDKYIGLDYINEAIHEMWNEFWSTKE